MQHGKMDAKKAQFLHIYNDIVNELKDLLQELDIKVKSIKEKDFRDQAIYSLGRIDNFRKEIEKNMLTLANESDWSTYTMAFYGETGAGKSTLIEALRLLLGEETKKREHKQYSALTTNLKSLTEDLAEKEVLIDKYAQQRKEVVEDSQALQHQMEALQVNSSNTMFVLENEKNVTTRKIEEGSVWTIPLSSIRSYLRKKKENEAKLVKIKQQIEQLKSETLINQGTLQKRNADLNAQIVNINKSTEKLKNDKEQIENRIHSVKTQLELCQDGAIIGDGRRDFTRKTQSYIFYKDDKMFRLLDLPGIEGKESEVQEEIYNSLKRAHAVFYISRECTSPQKGDENADGTLEKIRKHLNDQAEVYAIWNASVPDTERLRDPFSSSKNKRVLKILDQDMAEVLGTYYKGHILMSAQPAFLGVAKYLQEGIVLKRQKKFLKEWTCAQLLEESRVAIFAEELWKIADPAKIKKANLYKIMCALHVVAQEATKYRKVMREAKRHIEKRVEDASRDIQAETKKFMEYANGKIGELGHNITVRVYEQVDKKIENKIGDKELKKDLETALERTSKGALKEIERDIETYGKTQYEGKIEKILERIKEQVNQYNTRIAIKANLPVADFKIPTDWNFKKILGLGEKLATIGGAIKLIIWLLPQGGWAIAAAIVVAMAVCWLCKRIYDFIKDNTWGEGKKARQRKEVGKVLAKFKEELQKYIPEIKSQIRSSVKQRVSSIEEDVYKIPLVFKSQEERMTQFIDFLSNQNMKLRRM